ncbi:MAG: tRNA 2-selenouridine(34) synthase MnmH [Gammaproteobacteria bacterium]|nr:tRNA 2-selenouridine(34) synthase MnmH [Gammaproteobacteria bacterium]
MVAPPLPEEGDLRRIILHNLPLIDLRAPLEFNEGSLPTATNLPLMSDEERHQVGLCYAEEGQEEAIALGHELVEGEVKAARVQQWQQFAQAYPEGLIFCWRGGMRSKISQQWLFAASGIRYPRIVGGYKAVRRFLLDEIDRIAAGIPLLILGGRTGTGKTLLLQPLPQAVDLEGMAHHRGSAFGPRATPQPTQINFENRLAVALIQLEASTRHPLLIEDEGRNIGSRTVPEKLYQRMAQAPLLLLEASLEERISITHREYIEEALQEYRDLHGEETGFELWSQYLFQSLDKIRKRLGGLRHQTLRQQLEQALLRHHSHDDPSEHRGWIATLLRDYYDPMYDYQLSRKQERIHFRGSYQQILDYLRDHSPE